MNAPISRPPSPQRISQNTSTLTKHELRVQEIFDKRMWKCHTLKDFLRMKYTLEELKGARYSATEFKEEGVPAKSLKEANFTAKELRDAGFHLDDLKLIFSLRELSTVYTVKELRDSGFHFDDLKVTFSLKELNTAYTLKELKDFGYKLKDFRKANFTIALLTTEFSPEELKSAYTAKDFKSAGYSVRALKAIGFTPNELGSNEFQYYHYTNKQIANEYTIQELIDSNYMTKDEIMQARLYTGYSLKAAGYSAEELQKSKKYDVYTLRMSCEGIEGYTLNELKNGGFTLRELSDGKFTVEELKDSGYEPKDFREASFTIAQLTDTFSLKELKSAYTAKDFKSAGFRVKELKNIGFTPNELRPKECDSEALEDWRFTNKEITSEFTPEELIELYYYMTRDEIMEEGLYTGYSLKAAEYTARELKDSKKYNVYTLRMSYRGMAGYTLPELKDGGFTPQDFKDGGCDIEELLSVFSREELKDIVRFTLIGSHEWQLPL